MSKTDISDLAYPDKVEIFRHLAVDESNNVNISILDAIATTHYSSFMTFCEEVFNKKEDINSIECIVCNDDIRFEMR